MRPVIRLVLLFPLALAFAAAQISGPVSVSAPAMYEGQKVGEVELISNPRVAVEGYRRLISQGAGAPFSTAKVQASLNALKQTNHFSKVEIEVQPEATGIKLSFILQPAFYYGLLRFSGAEKKFAYTRLSQAVDLPDGEPYERDDVTKGEASLLKFLQKNGYFRAQVRTETKLDDPHQLANIIFDVRLNRRAKVGQVVFPGVPSPKAARLRQALRSWHAKLSGGELKPGKTFTSERLQAAERFLQSWLVGQGWLIQQLRVGTIQFHPDSNRADVNFEIRLGPNVSVKLVGARLTWVPFLEGRKMRQLIPIYSEGSTDPDLIMEGERNLIDFFQTKGYFDVKVQSQVTNLPDRVLVVYRVNKGRRHTVAEVTLAGNQSIPSSQLQPQLAVTEGGFLSHGTFSNKLVKKTVENLTAFYRNNGFQDAKVTPKVVDREPKIYATFKIAEGEQTIIEGLQITGNQRLTVAQVQPPKGFQLAPGSPFSAARLTHDRNQIVANYLDRGYPRMTFNPKVTPLPYDKHRVNVEYVLDEGQQVHMGNVVVLGNDYTRRTYIARTMALDPEAPLSQTKLLAAESELYNLGVLDWASVGPLKPVTNETQEEVVSKVHEAKRNSVTYGFGFEYDKRAGNIPSGTVALPGLPPLALGKTKFATSEQSFVSPRGSVEYIRRDMRGVGETLSIATLIARLDQRLLLGYAQPHFLGSDWSSSWSASGERTSENPIFTARLGRGAFQVERKLNPEKTKMLQLRYQFQRTTLTNLLIPQLVLPEDRSVRLSSLGASFIHDTRDMPLDAHKGIWDTVNVDFNPSVLGSNVNFARILARRAMYWPVKKSLVWANSLQLGMARQFAGSRVPESERFFSGGANSLRGFPVNGAGPQRTVPVCSDPSVPATCSNIHVPVGGNDLFIFNSELRFPLHVPIGFLDKLGGAAFYDGGNVYNQASFSSLVNNFTSTVGFGFRYPTPIGPIRFDVGRLLNPVAGFRATQYFVTLGQAF